MARTGCRCEPGWRWRCNYVCTRRRVATTPTGDEVPSKYSEVKCLACGGKWRTDAVYVEKLRDHRERKYRKMTDAQVLQLLEEGHLKVNPVTGVVRKQKRLAGHRYGRWTNQWIILKQDLDRNGYPSVRIRWDGHRKGAMVHRLVWMAVKRRLIPEGYDVDHVTATGPTPASATCGYASSTTTEVIMKKTKYRSDRLPRPRSTERQHTMFDVEEMTHGMCRVMAGDFMEEATAVLSSSVRLRTDCRCEVCPDIQYSKRLFFESKSVGNTDTAIIYQSRLRKDCDFCMQGYQIMYWFWHHHCQVSKTESKTELRHEIARWMQDVLVVPLRMIWKEYGHRGPKLLNNSLARVGKQHGWGAAGYGWGWNIPLNQWRNVCTDVITVSGLVVYDVPLPDFKVRLAREVPGDLATTLWTR